MQAHQQAAAQQQAASEQAAFEQAAAQPPAAEDTPPIDTVEQLKQLAALHTAGVLSDEEFAAAKSKLLGL